MNNWTLVNEGFEPSKEGLREALCTLGNGYFATRGAASESEADEIQHDLQEMLGLEHEKKYGDIQRLDRILESEGDSVNRCF